MIRAELESGDFHCSCTICDNDLTKSKKKIVLTLGMLHATVCRKCAAQLISKLSVCLSEEE